MALIDVNEQTFQQQVLESQLPVLVDLYADWCQPCKALEPVLAEVGRELEGKLTIARINIDQNPALAQAFRVQSIPMLMLIHQGRPVDQLQGLVDKQTLLQFVKPVLGSDSAEVTPKELAELLKRGQVLPVDVRDQGSYARYRIPSAINLPAGEVEARSSELRASDGRLRVLYGRSTDEAKELAEALQKKGISVAFLAGGFLHWEADGLQVERGS